MNPTFSEDRIEFETYGIDWPGLLKQLYEKLFSGNWDDFLGTLETWWTVYSIIGMLLAFLFFAGYIYAKIRYGQLGEIEQAALRSAEAAWANKHAKPDSRNARWDIIQKRVSENNPESWRIAIIEADIMLDETLTNAGYSGQSLGEKLKSANPQSFTTIRDAWDAHMVRNKIAHAGSDFILTQKVAQTTIVQFERVFREFGVV